jgi:hypothetical protein
MTHSMRGDAMVRRGFVLTSAACLLLAAIAPAAAQQPSAPASPGPQPRPVVPSPDRLRGFSITLVEGSTEGNWSIEGLPAAAARAIGDMKDFLPYKHCTLLDTEWTLGQSRIEQQLRGAEGRTYELEMAADESAFGGQDARQVAGVAISEFRLRDAGSRSELPSSTNEAYAKAALLKQQVSSLQAEIAALNTQIARLGASSPSPEQADAVKQRQAELQKALTLRKAQRDQLDAEADAAIAAGQTTQAAAVSKASLIDTSFRMNIGETVVVGTSRLQGDKALIVLLTAAGR